jgi:hypothetical protein
MSASEMSHLSVIKGDVEKAREYKDQVAELAKPICDVLTRAKKEGIVITYSLSSDATGNYFIAQLSAIKEL